MSMIIVSVLLVAMVSPYMAAAAIPACAGTLSTLAPCLAAVEGENPPKPTDACCAVIRNTEPTCLCSVVTAYSNSMGVNVQSALLLPKECKRSVPAGYTCDGQLQTFSFTRISIVHDDVMRFRAFS